MASLLVSSPLPLPISSGLGVFIFYLLPFSKRDRKFLLFHHILSLSVWLMLILPHSSHMSHMELLQPLLCNKKKLCTFILLQNLLFQQHQHCLDIRVQCLNQTESKKLHPTVPPECEGLHSPPLHSVLAPAARQSPRSEGRERWLQPPCSLLQSPPAFLHCIQNLQLMSRLALGWCDCVDIT